MKYFVASSLIICCLSVITVHSQCLKYETENIELVGTIFSKVFAGPPNYKSIKAGDRKEMATILKLKSSVCTSADDDPRSFNVAETDIRQIQLVITSPEIWRTIRKNRGKLFRAKGTLFHGHTGYHRTKVLLAVTDLETI